MFFDSVEEKIILKQKQEIENKEGILQEDDTQINVTSGVYPQSFFDLTKFPTKWKLVL